METELYLFTPQGKELIVQVDAEDLPRLLELQLNQPSTELAIVHPHLDGALEALIYWRQQLPCIPITLVSESSEQEHQHLEDKMQLSFMEIKEQLKINRLISHQFSRYKLLQPDQFKLKLGQVLKSYYAFEQLQPIQAHSTIHHSVPDDHHQELLPFIPIELRFLMPELPCHFALYIKGAAETFYKILYRGDSFSSERFEQYKKAKMTHFYLQATELNSYISYCSEVQQTLQVYREQQYRLPISINQHLPEEQLHHFSDHLMELFKREGVQDQSILFAKKFLKLGQNLIKQLKQDSILEYCLQSEHSTACALITGLFVEALQLDNQQLKEDLALAALLHDIGFTQLPSELRTIPLEHMTPAQIELYQSHPEVGYDLLLPLKGLSEGVKQAVRCHHERKSAKGYPRKIASTQISTMSEIVGLCEEYVEFHQIFNSESRKKFKLYFEEKLQFEFSAALTEVFRRCFLQF